ncbi:hypothetical protein ACU8OJ_26095 (plasmid) [Rhizobium leguminosarum]
MSDKNFTTTTAGVPVASDQCGKAMECDFRVDDIKLAGAFVRWPESIDRQKPNER